LFDPPKPGGWSTVILKSPHRLNGCVRESGRLQYPADLRTDKLDRRHQRIGQRHRPKHVEAELRAGLRIGGDAARIIVGGTGDEARTQLLEQRGFAQPYSGSLPRREIGDVDRFGRHRMGFLPVTAIAAPDAAGALSGSSSFSNSTPIRVAFRHFTRAVHLIPSCAMIRVKRSGIPTGLATSRLAPFSEILRT
jgi:hypothetical protein